MYTESRHLKEQVGHLFYTAQLFFYIDPITIVLYYKNKYINELILIKITYIFVILTIYLFFTFDKVIGIGNTFQGQKSPNIDNILKSN